MVSLALFLSRPLLADTESMVTCSHIHPAAATRGRKKEGRACSSVISNQRPASHRGTLKGPLISAWCFAGKIPPLIRPRLLGPPNAMTAHAPEWLHSVQTMVIRRAPWNKSPVSKIRSDYGYIIIIQVHSIQKSRFASNSNLLLDQLPHLYQADQRALCNISHNAFDISHTESASANTIRTDNSKQNRQRTHCSCSSDIPDTLLGIVDIPVIPLGKRASSPEVNLCKSARLLAHGSCSGA
jgi:hypothetical protein